MSRAVRPQPMTVYDVIKQRDIAREQARVLRRERDQLQMLCQIAAHYIRYLPLRPQDSDTDMIGRLEAAAKGDMDVAANPQATSPAQAGPGGPGPGTLRAPAGPSAAPAPSVQGDLHDAPAPDPGEGRSAKAFTLTAVEKKVLKRLGVYTLGYGDLEELTGLPRHKVISAMHTLQRFELVERAEGGWRRA
jgi:hypothetical protein